MGQAPGSETAAPRAMADRRVRLTRGCRPLPAPARRLARPRRPARWCASWPPGPAPSARPAGRCTAAPRATSSTAGCSLRRTSRRPSSSAMNPARAPAKAGPMTDSGGTGGGPERGATDRVSMMPAPSNTHRCANHQPSSVSVGLLMPTRTATPGSAGPACRRTMRSRANDGPGVGRRSATPGV